MASDASVDSKACPRSSPRFVVALNRSPALTEKRRLRDHHPNETAASLINTRRDIPELVGIKPTELSPCGSFHLLAGCLLRSFERSIDGGLADINSESFGDARTRTFISNNRC